MSKLRVAAITRKLIGMIGESATLFSMTEGAEDSFGDPTYTFSQVTLTVYLSTEESSKDEDKATVAGHDQQEKRKAYVEGTQTVVVGDELLLDSTATRYRIRGVVPSVWRGVVSYIRLDMEQLYGSIVST